MKANQPKRFVAARGGDILTSEHGFVYAWAAGSFRGNCICTVEFLEANRRRFEAAGWKFENSSANLKFPLEDSRTLP